MKEEVKKLWKLCFNDSEAFTELYFRLRYNDAVNIALQEDGEVIAALQMLPYPMTFLGEEIRTVYVSGACTHPDHRNRGSMRQLLANAFARMLQQGVMLSTLIPAEPWLFGYYARNGYAPLFYYRKEKFVATDAPCGEETDSLQTSDAYDATVCRYLNGKLKERTCCILHPEADFRVILADLQLSNGHLYTLYRHGNLIAAAVAYPTDNQQWLIGEVVSDTSEARTALLQHICKANSIHSLELLAPPDAEGSRQPLGMARIINAPALLQRYAANHPETELTFTLTDEQLPANSGIYQLSRGICTKSAKQLTESHLALTIGELTEEILAPLSPYMSLMLN